MSVSQNPITTAELHGYRAFCQRLSELSLIAACFFLPWSVALMNIATLLMALCWILSGKCLELPNILRRSPSAALAIALFLLLAASLVYTTATFAYGLDIVSKYRKLLYLPVVLSIVAGAPAVRRRAIDAFLWGCGLLLLVSYGKLAAINLGALLFDAALIDWDRCSLIYATIIDRHGFSIVHYITHGFFMALFIFFLIERAIGAKSGRWRWALFVVVALAGYNLFYTMPGRTGWGLCLALIAFICIRRCSWRWLGAGALVLAALIAITWQSSSFVALRCQELINETEFYQPGASHTSMGMRYDWWHNAIDLIGQAPWLGNGVGSFPREQAKLVASLNQGTEPSDNPHNEYLLITEQTGAVGLLLFAALLAVPVIEAKRRGLPADDRRLIEGVALAMALGCLANSFLFDSQQGHFFILMMALLLAADGAGDDEKRIQD